MKPLRTLLNKPRFWLIVITLIGGLLRFTYLLQIEHNTDRAYPIWQALMTLERGVFPLIGQGTSVLFANPPGMGYLLLPVMALTHHALGAYLFVIALNTLGIWFTYKAVRLIASPRAALIAAFLMAVNPWMIEYSRLTWVQGLLPFLVPALAWALWSALLGRAKHPARRLILAFVLLTIAAQTYLLAFALVIPVGLTVLLWLWRNPARKVQSAEYSVQRPHPPTPTPSRWSGGGLSGRDLGRGVVIGGVIFGVCGALYGVGLLSQSETVSAEVSNFSDNPSRLSGEALSHAIRLVTGQDYAIARGWGLYDWELRQFLSQIAHILLLVAMIGGGGLCVYRTIRGDRRGLLPLIWFGVPVVLMSYVGQIVHPFYQLIGIPAGFALAGIGIDAAVRVETETDGVRDGRGMPRSYGTVLLAVMAIPFGVLMAINSIRYAQTTQLFPGDHDLTALSLEYGLPLGEGIREKLPPNGTVFGEFEGWILSSFAGTTFDYIQDARAPLFYILPWNGGLYVDMTSSESLSLALDFSESETTTYLRDGSKLRLAELSSIGVTGSIDIRGDSGIDLVDAQLEGSFSLVTLWRVNDEVPDDIDETLYAPFAHIFDADGNRVLIVDGQAVPGYEWRSGDIHVHQMWFSLPEEGNPPYTVAIGQYDAQRGENAIFITPDGEYTALITLPENLTPDPSP